MRVQVAASLVSALFRVHPLHGPPPPGRPAGEYLADLHPRKPAKLVQLAPEDPTAHIAELQEQLDARAAQCGRDSAAIQLLEVHADEETQSTHLVILRDSNLLHVHAIPSPNLAFAVQGIDPPLCAEEPHEDHAQVLAANTTICEDTLEWVLGEVNGRRREDCPDSPQVSLEIVHANLKVAAGMVVGLVVQARDGSLKPGEEGGGQRPAFFHRFVVTWEYAALRSLQNSFLAKALEESTHQVVHLVPYAELPAAPCDLLTESTFTVGTLPVPNFFQRYTGYRGFEKGSEHIDLIPPSLPAALTQRRSRTRNGALLRKEESCPEVCPDGFSRHFADIFFHKGDSSCFKECGCSTDANYATICSSCCKVIADRSCQAVPPEPLCDDVPPPPASFDLREENPACFPPTIVEDQGLCGSCFAFASVSAAADRLCLKDPDRLIDTRGYRHLLSVQHFLSCNEPESDTSFPGLEPQKWGCDGGYFLAVSQFLLRHGGVLQDHYPYTSKCYMSHSGGVVNDQEHIANTQLGRHERTCDAVEKWLPRDLLPCACQEHSDKIKKCAKTQTKATKVRSIYRLPNLQDINPHTGTFYKMSDINKFMMVDLMTEGTLYAAFRVYEDFDGFFQNDPMGVYQHRYGQMIGGHAIVIVGWGEQDGVKYWLIRNSWGINWGDGGHFRIKRGSDECGIESRVWAFSTFDAGDGERPEAVNPWTLYGYRRVKTYDGLDLRKEDPRSLSHLKEECKFDPQCVGFDSAGQLKRALPTVNGAWKPLDAPIPLGDRVGSTPGGFYVKLVREKIVVTTRTSPSSGAGTSGPLEIYLCGAPIEGSDEDPCQPIPVELTGIHPGTQTFTKDAWLPTDFKLAKIEVFNRNQVDTWVANGPTEVTLPERPGSKKVIHKDFEMRGSIPPQPPPWTDEAQGSAHPWWTGSVALVFLLFSR